jgi:sugar/nucleoside kinase (ribokinase family)
MSHDILTIGAATRDIFLVSDAFRSIANKSFEGGHAECVPLGSKIEIQTFVSTSGGGATNAAATFRSLGYRTAITCRIGNDSIGRDLLEDLKKYRIETKYVNRVTDGQTAYSTLLTMPEGERTVLVYRGVSAKFTEADIHWSAIRKSKWVYLTSLGGNFELSKKIVEFAHKHHVKIAWNPGGGELKKGIKAFSSVLPLVDVFIINKEEAELLTAETNLKKLCTILKKEGMIRLITDGSKGTTLIDGLLIHKVGTSGTKGISKTGAGDAFGSGFVAAFLKFKDARMAARIGTINAESVIQHLGAKKGVLKIWPTESKLRKIKIV